MKANWRNILPLLLCIAPILLFAGLLAHYGVNAPHWDDHAIRIFVDEYSKQESFWTRLSSIFAYHNEHRIGLTRVFALLIYNFKGFLDFKTLQIFGFVGLTGVWWILILVSRKLQGPIWIYLIISLAIFNFSLHENLLWGMASVQNFWIIFLALGTFYHISFSLKKEYLSFSLALLFCTLAVFTSGNGVMVPVIGLLLLLVQKKWKWAGIWAVTSFAFLALYFQGYSEIPSKRWVLEGSTFKSFLASVASFAYVDADPLLLNYGGLTVLGGTVILICILVLFVSIFHWAQKAKQLQNTSGLLFLLGIGMFIFGTLAIVSLTRSDEGMALILSGKYKIYSFLSLAVLCIYGIKLIPKKLHDRASAILAILVLFIWSFTYIGYYKYFEISQMDRLTFALDNYRSEKPLNTSYQAPPFLAKTKLNFENAREDKSLVDSLKVLDDRILIWEKNASNSTEFAVFKSDSAVFFAGMKPIPSANAIQRIYKYYSDDKKGELDLLSFPSDLYEIYYLYLDSKELVNTGKILRIKGKPYTEAPKNW